MIVLGWCDLISNYAMCPGYQNYWQGFPKLLWLPELLARLAKIIGRRLPEVPPPHCCSINCEEKNWCLDNFEPGRLFDPTHLSSKEPAAISRLRCTFTFAWPSLAMVPWKKIFHRLREKNDHRRSLSFMYFHICLTIRAFRFTSKLEFRFEAFWRLIISNPWIVITLWPIMSHY